MKSTISKGNKLAEFCAEISTFCKKWWVRFVIGPLVMLAPPSLILGYYQYGKARQEAKQFLPDVISSFLDNQQLLVLLIVAGYWYLLTVITGLIQGLKHTEDIDLKGFLSLFETLESIVVAKADRFRDVLNKLDDGDYSADSRVVFLEITKPDQQIALQLKGLYEFFNSVDKLDVSFRATIVSIENEKPSEWFYYIPQTDPPRILLETLQSPNSAISNAIKSRDMVIVEDFVKEVKKESGACYVTENNKVEEGSLICYPVFDANLDTTPCVLTIAADKKKYFIKKKKPIYEWALKRFAVRIRLEHYLLELKQRVLHDAEEENKTR